MTMRTLLVSVLLLAGTAIAQEKPAESPSEGPAVSAQPADTALPAAAPKAAETAQKSETVQAPETAQPPKTAQLAQAAAAGGVKTMSGMSILGNEEAPKALVIVPWKSSKLGDGLGVANALDESPRPVDKDVFMRELHYYALRSGSEE
jgi:hypothetical protein